MGDQGATELHRRGVLGSVRRWWGAIFGAVPCVFGGLPCAVIFVVFWARLAREGHAAGHGGARRAGARSAALGVVVAPP